MTKKLAVTLCSFLLTIEIANSFFLDGAMLLGGKNKIVQGTIVKKVGGRDSIISFGQSTKKSTPTAAPTYTYTPAAAPKPSAPAQSSASGWISTRQPTRLRYLQSGVNNNLYGTHYDYFFGYQDNNQNKKLFFSDPKKHDYFDFIVKNFYNDAYDQLANTSPEYAGMVQLFSAIGMPAKMLVSHVSGFKFIMDQIYMWLSWKMNPSTKDDDPYKFIYDKVKDVERFVDSLVQNYLSDVDMIVVGTDNYMTGKKIFIKGSNMKINGNNAFSYNVRNQDIAIIGDNIVRTDKIQIRLNEAEALRKGNIPSCIKILDF